MFNIARVKKCRSYSPNPLVLLLKTTNQVGFCDSNDFLNIR